MGPACRIGDVCAIDVPGDNPPVKAEVVGFRENRVLLMPYEETEGIGYGSAVRNTGGASSHTGLNELIGRTVDAMGMPIDGQGPLGEVAYYPITGKRSNPMERPRIDTVIQMGVKAIDGLLTIGKGREWESSPERCGKEYTDGHDRQECEGGCQCHCAGW